MAFTAKSKLLRKAGKRQVVPKTTKPVEPINDGAAKLDTSKDIAIFPKEGEDQELVISPFRALLPYRPRKGEHVPTEKSRKAVMYASGLGMSQKGIADILNISMTALTNHYEEELKIARELMLHDIQTNLYNIARDPKHKNTVQAGIFLLSKLGGEDYKEKRSIELTGKDGQPLQIDQRTRTLDPAMLSHEQRDALRDILSSAMKLAQQPAPVQLEAEYKEIDGD